MREDGFPSLEKLKLGQGSPLPKNIVEGNVRSPSLEELEFGQGSPLPKNVVGRECEIVIVDYESDEVRTDRWFALSQCDSRHKSNSADVRSSQGLISIMHTIVYHPY